MNSYFRKRLLASTVFGVLAASTSMAQDVFWNNTSTNFSWDTSSLNWFGAAWNNANNNTARFGPLGIGSITLNAPVTAHGAYFQNNGFTIQSTGGNVLTLVSAGSGSTGPATIRLGSNILATIDAPVTTSGGAMLVDGAGTLVLGNQFSGSTLTGSTAIGTQNAQIAVLNSSTLRPISGSTLPGSTVLGVMDGALDVGSNTVALGGLLFSNNVPANPALVRGVIGTGVISLTNSQVYVAPSAISVGNNINANLSLTGTIAFNIGSNFQSTSSIISSNNLVINGNIDGNGSINYNSVSGTNSNNGGFTLNGNNSFSGGFALNSPSQVGVVYSTDSAFGTGTITVNALGTLRADGFRTLANNVILSNSIILDRKPGTSLGSHTFNGTIDLNTTGSTATRTIVNQSLGATFNGVIGQSGASAGLALSGFGPINLNNSNTYSGDTTILSGITLGLGSNTALSAGTLFVTSGFSVASNNADHTLANPIVISGGSNTYFQVGSFSLTFTGPVDLNTTGSAVVRTLQISQPALSMTFSGAMTQSGAGAVTLAKSGPGTLYLNGNATGGTWATSLSSGNLQFNDDTSFGSGSIALSGGIFQPMTSNTLSRAMTVSNMASIDVGVNNPTFSSVISGVNTATLNKAGVGTLTLTGVSPYAGTLAVNAGGVRFRDAGQLTGGGAVIVSNNALVILDESGTSNLTNRLTGSVTLNSGQLVLRGATAGTTAETISTLSGLNGLNVITVETNGGSGTSLSVTSVYTAPASGSLMLFRGSGMGTAGGSQVFLPGIANGTLLANSVGDFSTSGVGSFLVEYDTTLGVKPITYAQTNGDIQNPANGGSTPTNAHFLVNGVTSNNITPSSGNTIQSLTMSGAAPTVNIGGGANPSLTVSSGVILVTPNATGAALQNGTLTFGSATAQFTTNADLAVSSGMSGTGGMSKTGAGTLTLNGPYNISGSMNVGAGQINLNTNAVVTTVGGSGTVQIGSGQTLTATQSHTVGALLTGSGSVAYTPASQVPLTLTNANTYSGGTSGNANASYILTHMSGLGTGQVVFSNTTSQEVLSLQAGTGTFANNIQLSSSPGIASNFGYGSPSSTMVASLGGLITGGHAGSAVSFGTGTNFFGNYALINSGNTFQGTVQINAGTLMISDDGALGNSANAVQLNGGYLQFNNTLTMNRNVILAADGRLIGNSAVGSITGSISQTSATASLQISGASVRLAGPAPGSGALTSTNNVTVTGKLLVDSSTGGGPLGSAPVIASSSGATVGGTGTIAGSVTISGGGILAPGDSPGVLTLGNTLTMIGVSTLQIEIAGTASGTFDQVLLSGLTSTYTLGSSTTLSGIRVGGFVAPFGTAYEIVKNVGNTTANSGTGTFVGLPEGSLFQFDGQVFQIRYNVGTYSVVNGNFTTTSAGGSIVIAAVPEPTTWVLIGLAAGASVAGAWRWRRSLVRQEGQEIFGENDAEMDS